MNVNTIGFESFCRNIASYCWEINGFFEVKVIGIMIVLLVIVALLERDALYIIGCVIVIVVYGLSFSNFTRGCKDVYQELENAAATGQIEEIFQDSDRDPTALLKSGERITAYSFDYIEKPFTEEDGDYDYIIDAGRRIVFKNINTK